MEKMKKMREHLREGEGHQSSTNHYKVQNVPKVTKVGALVEKQAQHHHLKDIEHTCYDTQLYLYIYCRHTRTHMHAHMYIGIHYKAVT